MLLDRSIKGAAIYLDTYRPFKAIARNPETVFSISLRLDEWWCASLRRRSTRKPSTRMVLRLLICCGNEQINPVRRRRDIPGQQRLKASCLKLACIWKIYSSGQNWLVQSSDYVCWVGFSMYAESGDWGLWRGLSDNKSCRKSNMPPSQINITACQHVIDYYCSP